MTEVANAAAVPNNGTAQVEPHPYLVERGFTASTILEAGWRVEKLGQRYRRYGFESADAAEADVWLIPYRHSNGRIWFEVMRLIDARDLERFGGGKYRQPAGMKRALYDPFEALATDGPIESVLLVEGEANAVAVHAVLPDIPVVGLPGQRSLRSDLARQLGHVPVVFLWTDRHDPSAEENAQQIAERLREAGVDEVRQLPPAPGRMDANDVLREDPEHAGQFMREMLDAAAGLEPPIEDDWPLMPKPTPPRFPVDALPDTVAAFVNAVAAQTRTPPDMAAMGCLGVLSAVAQAARVDCGAWDEEALALYILVVSPSGDHKSTVLKKVAAPLYRLEGESREEARATRTQTDARRDMLKARREMLLRKASKLEEEDEWAATQAELEEVSGELAEASEYVEPRLLTDDATPEGLARLMACHPDGIAVVSAESATVNNLLGHYSDKGKANLHVVCKAVNGEGPISVDRGGAEPLFIARPLLAITLFSQPHVLKGILGVEVARDQGLVGRFVYADLEPISSLGYRDYGQTPPKVPHHLHEAWDQIVRTVRAACARTKGTKAPDQGSDDPFVPSVRRSDVEDLTLTLSSPSQELLTELLVKLEPRQREGADLRTFSDWLSRHHGRVARFAALLHLTQHSPDDPIDEQTMRSALRIGDYLFEHMLIALSAPDPVVRRALGWLAKQDGDTISQRDLHRGPLHKRGPAQDAAALAQTLVAIGALRSVADVQGPTGGRPKGPRYEINPHVRAR